MRMTAMMLMRTLGSMTTWYEDADQDDLGDPAVTVVACFQPVGYVSNSDDFCPVDPANPDADGDQICDSEDNCFDTTACNYDDSNNGICVYTITYYLDADGDGLGDASNPLDACWTPSSNYVLDSSDNCDDPSACNYAASDNSSCLEATLWFYDADGDGEGVSGTDSLSCVPPENYANTDGDNCDDPNACNYDFNSFENNPFCSYESSYYLDQDGDGFGDITHFVVACSQPEGYVLDSSDQCPNDFSKQEAGSCGCGVIDTDADEDGICDDIDLCTDTSKCNYDDPANAPCLDAFAIFVDADGDGLGSVYLGTSCELEEGMVAVGGDNCDDLNACNYSGANLPCTYLKTWYVDSDGDGLGELGIPTIESCDMPAGGYIDNSIDNCFDLTACNYDSVENNQCQYEQIWYVDADGDGFGSADSQQVACTQPVGYVGNANDCDDSDSGATVAIAWYANGPDGNQEVVYSCDSVAGYVSCIPDVGEDEKMSITIEWAASSVNDSIRINSPICSDDTILSNPTPAVPRWEEISIPFGAPTVFEVISPEADGFWNASDFDFAASSTPVIDNQKAPEYLHYSQLVDKTVSGAGTFVVYNSSRNQSTSLYDEWRWSGLHNASPRWAIPTAVAIGHKIASAATHSGVDNVRAITHSSTANAYGNSNYNNPGTSGVGCTGCGVLTGTNNLRGDHWSIPEENLVWYKTNNNYAMTSDGWYGTPATGSFNSIMDYYGHPTFGSANVSGVTTQTVFLPPRLVPLTMAIGFYRLSSKVGRIPTQQAVELKVSYVIISTMFRCWAMFGCVQQAGIGLQAPRHLRHILAALVMGCTQTRILL